MTEPMDTRNYAAVRALAQKHANETGCDYGLEKIGGHYRIFMLPQRQFRFGHERSCEVVMCETLAKCKPGHGPALPPKRRPVEIKMAGDVVSIRGNPIGRVRSTESRWEWTHHGSGPYPAPSRVRAILALVHRHVSWIGSLSYVLRGE